MLKKMLLPLIIILGLFLSQSIFAENAKKVSLKSVIEKGSDYVDTKIKFEGTVDHICKHSSKKLNLFGATPDESIDIFAGEGISQFPPELIGNNITVFGTVKEDRLEKSRVLDYIAKLEAEKEKNMGKATEKGKKTEKNGEKCEDEKSPSEKKLMHSKYKENMEYANGLLKQMKDLGKDYIPSYSVVCNKYEIQK